MAAAAVASGGVPDVAHAHAFGARYDLPLPLWLYLGAAAAAVALSFVAIVLLADRVPMAGATAASTDAGAGPGAARMLRAGLAAMSVFLLGVVVVAGAVGPQSPTANFATVFVWVIWWVGLALCQALVIDLWSIANPWMVIARLLGRCRVGRRLRYPAALGYWPAVLGFVVFVWLELISDVGERPRALAALVAGYTALTLLGALLFGSRPWFRYADPFSVVFATLARLAPLAACRDGWPWRLGAPGRGLLVARPVRISLVAVVLCLLATVSFDGFKETSAWAAMLDVVGSSERLRASLLALQGRGVDLMQLVETAGLLAALALFAAGYTVFAWLIDKASGRPLGLAASAGGFVLTLVPIAVGYHLAHYLSYLLIAGQLIIPLVSDPFGRGWDLFSSAGYTVDIAVVDARFVWYAAVTSVVIGHVVAVYLAHAMALRLYQERRAAVRSQLPMLVLMVAYTMTSLWILSQPIVAT